MSRNDPSVKAAGPRWLWALVVALIVAAWLPSLRGDFLLDDYGLSWLTDDEGRVDWGRTFGYFYPSHLERDQFLRPLPLLLGAVDLAIWGPDAKGFHLTNVLLHVLGALVVGALAAAVARRPGHATPRLLAMLTALVYGLYPGHAEAVGWVIHRMVGMSVLFAGLALLVHSRRRLRPLAWAITLAALLCKEPALVVPPAIVLFDRLRDPAGGWRGAMRAAIPYLIVVAVWFGWKRLCFGQLSTGYGAYETYGGYFLGEKIYLAIPGSLLRFVSPVNAAVWPDALRVAHVVVSACLLVVVGVGVIRARARVGAVACFGLGWAVLSLGLVAPFLRVSPELTNSRHFSAPALGLAIVVAAGVAGLASRGTWSMRVAALLLALWFLPQPSNLAPYVDAGMLAKQVRTGVVGAAAPGTNFVVGVPTMHRGAPVFGDGSMLDAAVAPPFAPRRVPVVASVASPGADPDSTLYTTPPPPPTVLAVAPDGAVRRVSGDVATWTRALPESIAIVAPAGGQSVRLLDDVAFAFRPDRRYRYYRLVFRVAGMTVAFTVDASTDVTTRDDGTLAYHLSRGDVSGCEDYLPRVGEIAGAVTWHVEGVDDHTRVQSALARSAAATFTATR